MKTNLLMNSIPNNKFDFKRPYNTPKLNLFGKIAALTNGASGNCMDDSSVNCSPASGTMAMA